MKVYYDASIWERQSSHKINEKPGIKQLVNWRFNYLGKEYGELGSYKVIPALEKHESLIFDQSMQFEQVEEHKKGHYSKEGGSIGIIGGASGPTAIFLARKKDTTPIQYCYSKLSDCMQSHTFYLESIRTLETKGQTYIFNI